MGDLVPSNSSLQLAHAAEVANQIAAQGTFNQYRARLSTHTLRAQDADFVRWSRYLEAMGMENSHVAWNEDPRHWKHVSWGLIEGFLQWQSNAGYSLATIARSLATIRAYCTHATRAGVIAPEAMALIQTIHSPHPDSRAGRNKDAQRPTTRRGAKKANPTRISREQARRLRDNHPDTPVGRRDALLMCLLLDHGLRSSEVADLQVTDLDLAQGVLRFYRRKVHMTQTHRLSRATLRAAQRYVEAGDAPANGILLRTIAKPYSQKLGGPINAVAIGGLVRRLGVRIGLYRLSPHDCRHFWATRAAAAGTDPIALQEAGGWNDLTMPRIYIERAAIANARVQLGADLDE
ncbi:tyrosine-type recombinase/integrase [Candidatus Oscillochloris fontis]|uniref:tyrosine-type recombinase/integrase n=1 Tax=Candidatus Oscillochloris fontis TaxID=2496868 RepID=UPI00101CE836|nr:site-specific integrase [Candidatus Oscillochloris fontis]